MKAELVRQYRDALLMLDECIEKCPDRLWNNTSYGNVYWHIAYHTLFYTDLYLAKGPGSFIAWEKHMDEYQVLDKKDISTIYTIHDLRSYLQQLMDGIDQRITDDGWEQPCGFNWRPVTKGGLYFYNLRHLQHHVGQLVERLRANGICGIRWR